MLKTYLRKLRLLWRHPSVFFEEVQYETNLKDAGRFAVITGLIVALEIGIFEVLSGGDLEIVAVVTAGLLVLMPLAVMLWIYGWAGFMRLCGLLLGNDLPSDSLRRAVAYSTGGWIPFIVGFGLGKWLALMTFAFQFFGVEKGLRCSRWAAAVYVGLPFSIIAVIFGMVTLMFKVFK
jgi:hypothetical protein